MDEYYIKGGKAFLYYFQGVPTIDMDIVITEKSCDTLFRDATSCWMGKWIQLDGYEPFEVVSMKETKHTYKDKEGGKTVKHQVRTLFVNGMTLIDAIIVKEIQPHEVELSEDGLYYMEKTAFVTDLMNTYEDRVKKCRYLNMYDDKSYSFFQKLERNYVQTCVSPSTCEDFSLQQFAFPEKIKFEQMFVSSTCRDVCL
jgi:hypothetical protein